MTYLQLSVRRLLNKPKPIYELCHPCCVRETWKMVRSQTQLCHMRCI